MAYVAVDKNGDEVIFQEKPERNKSIYNDLEHTDLVVMCDRDYEIYAVDLPKGSIEKLIGHKLTWEDEPVELVEK